MCEILCVTNRRLCKEDFLTRIEHIAANHPAGILLREKDLPETEYRKLALKVQHICKKYRVPCILHSFSGIADELGADAFHAPLPLLREMSAGQRAKMKALGASCHSIRDAQEAAALGCTYIIAGHIFDTDCKRGTPGRGLAFLHGICSSVSIPVYAIGGISSSNISALWDAGAKGACIMSGLMQCPDVKNFLASLRQS